MLHVFLAICLSSWINYVYAWWDMPNSGYASMTHYYLPKDAVAACGCTAKSDHYPTAALSWLAYNHSDTVGFGPACGKCIRAQLINTIASDPVWYPENPPSIVIKITDLCPDGGAWCNATAAEPNAAGHFVNFDLAWPSVNGAIPDDFFPTNASYYGYTDFGVWNVSYEMVPCVSNWNGIHDQAAIGAVPDLGDSVCCPADPVTYPNTTCPSFGDAPISPSSGTQRMLSLRLPFAGSWMAGPFRLDTLTLAAVVIPYLLTSFVI